METPEFFHGGYYVYDAAEFSPDKRLLQEKNGDNFIVDELLDLPNDVTDDVDGGSLDVATADSSTVTTALDNNSSNSSFSGDMTCHHLLDGQFSSDFSVPYDDLAELEWLSSIVEEPFSSEDMEKMQLISGIKAARNDEASEARMAQPDTNRANAVPMFRPDVTIPAKARSKRTRVAPGNWTSRILAVTTPLTNTVPTIAAAAIMAVPAMSSSSESDVTPNHGRKRMKATLKKKESSCGGGGAAAVAASEGRRCLHCDTDKTPQWRTGPMGPKTLCNACGVRYKSGRLVPEYRPAASPTFVLSKHSNSHRKVLEIRRQKELRAQQQQPQFIHQNMMFDVSNGNDYLIHQQVGPDYRQLI